MREETYKTMYNKIKTSAEMDQKILDSVVNYKQENKLINMKNAYKVAAVILTFLIVGNITPIKVTASKFIGKFTNKMIINEEQVDMEESYIHINPKAPKKACKMDSIKEVNEKLDIKLLDSKQAHNEKNCIEYWPYVSAKKTLNGVVIMNQNYNFGDLKNAKLKTHSDTTDVDYITYEKGEKYSSPIGFEITIRGDNNEGVDYYNLELDYGGRKWDLKEGVDGVSNINVMDVSSLGVEVTLFCRESDGHWEWNKDTTGTMRNVTHAIFIYNGVEYHYFGDVSQDTMIEFLNTLE